jgi:hypothetical protein
MLISTALFLRLSGNTFVSCGTTKFFSFGLAIAPLVLLSATEQTLPLTDVDVFEDPKRLKREWETPTEVVTV